VVPIGRHPQQLPTLLEALARLRMEPAVPLLEAVRAGNHLPWGISCVCFSAENGGGTASFLEYFGRRHVPAILFVTRPGVGAVQTNVRPLDAILLEEPAA